LVFVKRCYFQLNFLSFDVFELRNLLWYTRTNRQNVNRPNITLEHKTGIIFLQDF